MYLEDEKLVRWYGENCNCIPRSEKLRAIPLGLENRYWKTDREFSHLSRRARNIAPFDQRRIFLYINIGLHSNPDRARIIEHFRALGIAYIVPDKRSFMEYVDDLSDSKFVLSPFGNGIDCHRTWEVRNISVASAKENLLDLESDWQSCVRRHWHWELCRSWRGVN
jgi:hypothetical protein